MEAQRNFFLLFFLPKSGFLGQATIAGRPFLIMMISIPFGRGSTLSSCPHGVEGALSLSLFFCTWVFLDCYAGVFFVHFSFSKIEFGKREDIGCFGRR